MLKQLLCDTLQEIYGLCNLEECDIEALLRIAEQYVYVPDEWEYYILEEPESTVAEVMVRRICDELRR